MKLIKAKFKSTCPNCNKSINRNDLAYWERGKKAVHKACINAEQFNLDDLVEEQYQIKQESDMGGSYNNYMNN